MWSPADSPIVIVGNVTIDAGVTLTILAGTVIEFEGFYSIVNLGNLEILGDSDSQVHFLAQGADAGAGSWASLTFRPGSTGVVSHAIVAFPAEAFRISSDAVSIDHTFIKDAFVGASIENEARGIRISDSSIVNASVVGVAMSTRTSMSLDNVTIRGHESAFYGFFADGAVDVWAGNLTISGFRIGLFAQMVTALKVVESESFLNEVGASLSGAGVDILRNSIHNNSQDGVVVVGLDNSTIDGNRIEANGGSGLNISMATTVRVQNNTIGSNGFYGISLEAGQAIEVIANVFVDNLANARDRAEGTAWSRSYPTGGNTWDDYQGCDLRKGPLQDVDGGDGFGDWPYLIPPGSFDNYPRTEPDVRRPSRINTLSAAPTGSSQIRLEWLAPGDDFECGTVTAYDVRFFTAPFDESDWGNGQRVAFGQSPKPVFKPETLQVDDLIPGTTYYFGVRALDDAGNTGALSNTASARTWDYNGPELGYLHVSPDPQEVYRLVTVVAQFIEIIPVPSVRIRVWSSTSLLVDDPMALTGGEWSYESAFGELGTHDVEIAASDEIGLTRTFSTTFVVQDTTRPSADAGADISVALGSRIGLDGSGSSDNFGIANYTWTIIYDSQNVLAYGSTMTFAPDRTGTYLVRLTVTDHSGNADTDDLWIKVLPEGETDWVPHLAWFLLAAVLLALAVLLVRRRHLGKR